MRAEHYEKIITINDQSYEVVSQCVERLIFFMYQQNSNVNIEYFRLRLKDSEKSPFSKDLLLEWCCSKQPENSPKVNSL